MADAYHQRFFYVLNKYETICNTDTTMYIMMNKPFIKIF